MKAYIDNWYLTDDDYARPEFISVREKFRKVWKEVFSEPLKMNRYHELTREKAMRLNELFSWPNGRAINLDVFADGNPVFIIAEAAH
jgi:hypothetical protein